PRVRGQRIRSRSRRDRLRRLARRAEGRPCAAAACVSRRCSAGRTGRRREPIVITGFWHAGLTVSSMERSLAFYRDLLGLEIVSDRTVREAGVLAVTGTAVGAIRVCMLRVPGADAYLELLQYDALRPAGAAARP